jgi:uncharacterized membrane protein YccC
MHITLKPPRDPGYAALRRAARAAVVIPLVFAFADLLLGEPQSLIFVIFGSFALLVMSDFGGTRRPRAIAYLSATLVGAALVALGTLVSFSPPLAVGVMLIVGFVISFSRIFGGYIAAANTGMLLAFVIAVTIPGPTSVIPARVGGWTMAGLVSTLAAVTLWPRFERVTMQQQAANAVTAIAAVIQGMSSTADERELPRLTQAARQVVQSAQHDFTAMAKRPTAPARHDRAFAQLLIEMDRIVHVFERPFHEDRPTVRPGLPEGDRLVATLVAALHASAGVLTGGSRPDLPAITAARGEHRAALDRWTAAQLQAGRPTGEVLDGIDFDHTLGALSPLVFVLSQNAIIAAGRELAVGDTAIHILRTIRTHLESPSTVLQGSIRVAIGLAIAVGVARAFDLQHAFWVVLGTIQVLRTNVLGTGRSVVQAVAGNTIGVFVGGLFAVLAGNHPPIMWVAFPFAVFGAAYAVTTVGFLLAQAAFTINLLIVFNLISPAGWQVGLVRIEDLAVGALISLVIGVLLWPQGPRRELARALGTEYRDAVRYLENAFDRVLGFDSASGEDRARRVVSRARDRAGEAFESFLSVRGGALDQQTAAFLLAAGDHAILGGDLLEVVSGPMGYRGDSSADGVRQVHEQVENLLRAYTRLADRLSLSEATEPEGVVSSAALRVALLDCLQRWQADPDMGKDAMAVVIASEWVQNLARLEGDMVEPVGRAVEDARKPWWR